MKMTRKILPALAMLIVSAVMLSTASFAWFAMSTEVAANNMNVSVTSDAANLVISKNKSDVTNNSSYNGLSVDLSTQTATDLLPTAFDSTKKDGTTPLVSSSFAEGDTWYTMKSNNPDVSTGVGDKAYVAAEDLGDYVLVNTVYVGISAGSNTMYNLQAKATIQNSYTPNGDEGNYVNVLVVCTDLATGFQNFNSTIDNYTGAVVLASEITAANPVKVDIYVYYNGNHPGITSVNLAGDAIKDTVVSVKFTATTTNPNP